MLFGEWECVLLPPATHQPTNVQCIPPLTSHK